MRSQSTPLCRDDRLTLKKLSFLESLSPSKCLPKPNPDETIIVMDCAMAKTCKRQKLLVSSNFESFVVPALKRCSLARIGGGAAVDRI